MKKFFLCVIALAFCAAFPGCVKDYDADTVKSTWESKTEAGIMTLEFTGENKCNIMTGSGKPGMYDSNREFFDYWPLYGPDGFCLYNCGDTENARYIAKYSSDRTHLTLVPIRNGEEVESEARVLTRQR